MKKVAVVILNWNGKSHLENFLPSVIRNTREESTEIIIVDNASTDNSIAFLKETYPELRIIINPKNEGFAMGYNTALQQINAEYYVLLNSDVEVTENWISPLITYLDEHPDVGIAQPKILSYAEKRRFEYAGGGGGFIDRYGYPFCRGRIFDALEIDNKQYDDIQEIFWASGACFFVRAALFQQMGGFDNSFFAHMEEIDFCWRCKHIGVKSYYLPYSTVFHLGGGTLPQSSPFKTFLNFRNNHALLFKNIPKNRLFATYIIRVFLDLIAAVKFLFQKNGHKDFAAIIRAHIAFIRMIPDLKEKRKMFTPKPVRNMYKNSIVFDFFLKGKKLFSQLPPNKFS